MCIKLAVVLFGGGITCLCERFAWGTKDCYSAHPQAIFQNDQKGYVKGEIYLSHFEGQMYKRKEELRLKLRLRHLLQIVLGMKKTLC